MFFAQVVDLHLHLGPKPPARRRQVNLVCSPDPSCTTRGKKKALDYPEHISLNPEQALVRRNVLVGWRADLVCPATIVVPHAAFICRLAASRRLCVSPATRYAIRAPGGACIQNTVLRSPYRLFADRPEGYPLSCHYSFIQSFTHLSPSSPRPRRVSRSVLCTSYH